MQATGHHSRYPTLILVNHRRSRVFEYDRRILWDSLYSYTRWTLSFTLSYQEYHLVPEGFFYSAILPLPLTTLVSHSTSLSTFQRTLLTSASLAIVISFSKKKKTIIHYKSHFYPWINRNSRHSPTKSTLPYFKCLGSAPSYLRVVQGRSSIPFKLLVLRDDPVQNSRVPAFLP